MGHGVEEADPKDFLTERLFECGKLERILEVRLPRNLAFALFDAVKYVESSLMFGSDFFVSNYIFGNDRMLFEAGFCDRQVFR